ncbi:hypothetical protein [Pontibacter harenae]|uniref:hypothetical protein n=1 Tax=Pontibacter harenae TaxID=2894083 RepID=UPI001E376B32|nr:hypothetical protein [Pontibacter harenae]MCC9166712.1 hypothetical protein [Pontibacter harenae]
MRYLAFLAIILLAGVAFAQPKLKKTQISKEISVSLPQDFTPMTDDMIARSYPATTKPLAVYTAPSGQIDFSVTQKRSMFGAGDLDMLREFYKASIMEKFTKVDFIRQEVTKIKGQPFIVFEFVSSLAGEKNSMLKPVQKYSIIQYTIKGDQLMIFTLHAPFAMKNDWQPTAREIMDSVKM